jgi:hypothetical protein
VATQQGTIILAGFMSEQLEGDLKRSELVSEGKLSKREADEQAEKWEKVGREKSKNKISLRNVEVLCPRHWIDATL